MYLAVARSTNRNGPWSTIGGATTDAYMPADADLNRFLRATASYDDGEGSDKTAEAVSTNQMQPATVTNTAPEFPVSESGQREVEENTPAEWAAICAVAQMLGPTPETVRKWVRKAEARVSAVSENHRQRIVELERENRELRRANEILKAASAFFARELDPQLPK